MTEEIYSAGWGIYVCEKCSNLNFKPFINNINVIIPCKCGNVAVLEDIIKLDEIYAI